MNYHDARNFRLFAEAYIKRYDVHIHTDTVSVLPVNVGLAQAHPMQQGVVKVHL